MRARAEKAEAEVRALEDVLDADARRMHRLVEREAELAERDRWLGASRDARGRAAALALGALLGGALVAALVLPRWAAERAAAAEENARHDEALRAVEAERDEARAEAARAARAEHVPPRVPADVRVVRASSDPGVAPAVLEAVPELRLPPFDALGTMSELSHETAALALGVPLEVPLPGGREACVVLDGTTETGRYRVRLLLDEGASSAYEPYRTVLAAPGAPFFLRTRAADGAWLVVAIELGETPALGPLLSAPAEPRPATAFLRGQIEAIRGATEAEVLARVRDLFAIETMARAVLGPRWDELSSAGRERIESLLVEVIVARSRLGRVAGDDIVYAVEDAVEGGARVVTLVSPREEPRAEPIEVAYVMRQTDAGWSVIDVERDDVGLVDRHRPIARDALLDGRIDALLGALRRHLEAPAD